MTTTTSSTASAYLPSLSGELIVRPAMEQSVSGQVARVIFTGEQINEFRVPVVNADPAANWIAEGAEITPSDPDLDEATTRFLKLAGLTIVSNELAADSSPEAVAVVGAGLVRDIARKLDAAFFGTNVGFTTVQPAGLENLVGVNAIDGGSAWTNSDPFVAAIFEAADVDATLTSFVCNPADAILLAQVKDGTGSNRPLLVPDASAPTRRVVEGLPLYVSPAVTQGTVWGIPEDRALLVMRDEADFTIDYSAYFSSDRAGIRAICRTGFVFTHPAAIQRISLTP